MGPGKINTRAKTPKRLKNTIKKESIDPAAYNAMKLPWSCEDCTHFDYEKQVCTLGYLSAPHRREQQRHDYYLSGQIALCRFQEID